MDTLAKRYCWVRRAELAMAQEDPALALDITDRLIASAPGMSPGRTITHLWKLKAEALASMGHPEQASPLLIEATTSARVNGEQSLLWYIHADLGRFYRALGDPEAAEKEYRTAQTLIDKLAVTIPDQTMGKGFQRRSRRILLAS
jgi:tetratricopeptide (TPR) repeat protein